MGSQLPLNVAVLAERLDKERQLREMNAAAMELIHRRLEDRIAYNRELREQGELAHGEALTLQTKQFNRQLDEVREGFKAQIASLDSQIEIERNARIRSEGSVAVWRFIAVFLGFPGIVALGVALFAVFNPTR